MLQKDREYFDHIDEAASKFGLSIYTDEIKTTPKNIIDFSKELAEKWQETESSNGRGEYMKYEITATETLEYTRKFTVEIPDDMEEGTLNSILDQAENRASRCGEFAVVYGALEEQGCKIIEYADDGTDSPDRCDITISDFDEVE